MKSLIFLPEAKEEMNQAAKYYDAQASVLGVDYLSEIVLVAHLRRRLGYWKNRISF